MIEIFVVKHIEHDNMYWTEQEPAGWTTLPSATRYVGKEDIPTVKNGVPVKLW